MRTETRFGSAYTRADMLVTPDKQGVLEWPLLNFLIRHAADHRRGLIIEHPSDDEAATAALQDNRFEAIRRLTHMLWLPPQSGAVIASGFKPQGNE
jgi:hypothetical protein